jgi:hypothetical protein
MVCSSTLLKKILAYIGKAYKQGTCEDIAEMPINRALARVNSLYTSL